MTKATVDETHVASKEEEFINRIEFVGGQTSPCGLEGFLCKGCHGLLTNPQVLPGCYDTLCKKCVDKLSGAKHVKCPCGKLTLISDVFPNVMINSLLDLPIRCDLSSECKWMGKRSLCVSHYRNTCQFLRVACTNSECPETPFKKDLETHKSLDCGFVEDTCQYCLQSFMKKMMPEHHEECEDLMLECPGSGGQGGCGVRMKRKEIPLHELTCPERIVACVHQKCDMTYKFKEKEMHEKECLTRKVPCADCDLTIVFIDKENHSTSECSGHKLPCPDCRIMYPRIYLKQKHVTECIWRAIPCKTCGKSFPLKDRHWGSCPKEQIRCEVGCEGPTFARECVAEHRQECPLLKCPGCHIHQADMEVLTKHIARCGMFLKCRNGVLLPHGEFKRKYEGETSPLIHVMKEFQDCNHAILNTRYGEMDNQYEDSISFLWTDGANDMRIVECHVNPEDASFLTITAESDTEKRVAYLCTKYLTMLRMYPEKNTLQKKNPETNIAWVQSVNLSSGWHENQISGEAWRERICHEKEARSRVSFHPLTVTTCKISDGSQSCVSFPPVLMVNASGGFPDKFLGSLLQCEWQSQEESRDDSVDVFRSRLFEYLIKHPSAPVPSTKRKKILLTTFAEEKDEIDEIDEVVKGYHILPGSEDIPVQLSVDKFLSEKEIKITPDFADYN